MLLNYTECCYGMHEDRESEFLFIPGSSFIYGNILRKGDYLELTNINTLEEISEGILNGKISAEILESKGWDLRPIILPRKYISNLNDQSYRHTKAINRIR